VLFNLKNNTLNKISNEEFLLIFKALNELKSLYLLKDNKADEMIFNYFKLEANKL
jgi:hypothetical protein